jgi:hypothetical protein
MMTRTGRAHNLTEVEAYVVGGKTTFANSVTVEELEQEGRDAKVARNLLAIFEDLQKQYIAERNRLIRASEMRD